MSLPELIVAGANRYLWIGLGVAVPFALFGVGRIEPSARGGSPLFRLLIVPGACLLWPLIVVRAVRAARVVVAARRSTGTSARPS